MADWAKIKFFYNTMLGSVGSTFFAISTESAGDFDALYLFNMFETNMWKSGNSSDVSINYNAGHGQLTNGDFETGDTTGWLSGVSGIAVASFAAYSSAPVHSGTCKGTMTITNTGSSIGDVYLDQIGLSIVKGLTYRVIFYARAETAFGIQVGLIKLNTPTTLYADEGFVDVTLTGSFVRYVVMFTANITADDAELVFHMGNGPTVVDFDEVGFYEDSAVSCDYLALQGHNINSVGGSFRFEYSETGAFTGEEVNVIALQALATDKTHLFEFSNPGVFRYWRIVLSSLSAAPFITSAIWGLTTELDYASASFDPYAQVAKANVNITQGGYMAGTHTKHIERSLALRFSDADSTLYDKVKAWHDISGLKNFFVAWETGNNSTDVYLMRPDARFDNPLTYGGSYRDISISLKGRKE